MIAALVGLLLIIGRGFLHEGAALLFTIRKLIGGAQRVFDAVHRAERIFRVQIRLFVSPYAKESTASRARPWPRQSQ